MPFTMREVAQRAGVSLATVSYVVNGGPRPVSAERKERVLAVMRELGYQPTGRSRARARTLKVGLIVPDATNLFFSMAIAGIQSVLHSEGHLLITGSSDEDPARERDLMAAFTNARVDGLILTPCRELAGEVERRLTGKSFPVVLMDRDGDSSALDRVVLDNYRSAFLATRLLIESGHRRIAMVNGPESVVTARERQRGYRDALERAGMLAFEQVRSVQFTHDDGRRATLDLLSQALRPEAIFSSSVILTSGVVRALQERRLRWPDDIAIVGYGDAQRTSLVTPPLTVIQQPAYQLGEVAVQLLLASRQRTETHQSVVLESPLVLRESHWRVSQPTVAEA
jgi:LacI family transcriptional regulator